MCGFNSVYHDLIYASMGDQCIKKKEKKKKKLGQNKFNHIKLRLLQFLQILPILKMNKFTSAS